MWRPPSTTVSCVLVLALQLTLPRVSDGARPQPPPDPVLGTWSLVVDKSVYDPGRAPRSQTRTYEVHADGVRARIVTVDADGQESTVVYIADYDSMEYPLVGTSNADALALVRLDPLLAEGTITHAGRVMARARRVISPDERMMTITVSYESGRNYVAVYERVPEP